MKTGGRGPCTSETMHHDNNLLAVQTEDLVQKRILALFMLSIEKKSQNRAQLSGIFIFF